MSPSPSPHAYVALAVKYVDLQDYLTALDNAGKVVQFMFPVAYAQKVMVISHDA